MDPVDQPPAAAPMLEKPIPPYLRTALSAPEVPRRGWQWASGPFYIGLFLWVAYFDQLPQATAIHAGVHWSAFGVLLGGLLATACLYWIPARVGFETRQTLPVVLASTFGVRGAAWIPGRLLALTSIFWIAVATQLATDFCLKALVILRFVDPRLLSPVEYQSFSTPSNLFLVVSLLWALASAFTGKYLIRVIAALMNVFQLLPAILLGVCALKAFGGLPGYRPIPTLLPEDDLQSGIRATLLAAQMVLGFFATSGLSSIDWGAASPTRSDWKQTGIVGVGFASTIIGVLAILTVAGALGGRAQGNELLLAESTTFHGALSLLFSPNVTAILLIAFGLPALAPSVYAGFQFGTQMHAIRPRRSRTWWTFVASIGAWLLILMRVPTNLFLVFSFLGALVAPAVGALMADVYCHSGTWSGPRKGINRAGLLSWFAGLIVGLLPMLGEWRGNATLSRFQPATLFGLVAAFVVYLVLAKVGMEPDVDTREELTSITQPTA